MIKTLFIILSMLPVNIALAENNYTPESAINSPDKAALNIIKGTLSKLKELKRKNQGTPENIKNLIKAELLSNIAIDVSTQLTLKKYWGELNSQQKDIFQQYITMSLIEDYGTILSSYENLNNINITASPKIQRRDNKAIVKLAISFNKNQPPLKATLKMIHSDRWRMYDLVFSGVSLIKNHQAQFNSHIKRKGINSLVDKIANK